MRRQVEIIFERSRPRLRAAFGANLAYVELWAGWGLKSSHATAQLAFSNAEITTVKLARGALNRALLPVEPIEKCSL
jgi:hypothetical protein